MKFFGALLGLAAAGALDYWVPKLLFAFTNSTLIYGGTMAISAALTAIWAMAFQRLASLEKLDDLSSDQKTVVIQAAIRFRRAIISSIVLNALVLVITTFMFMMGSTTKDNSTNLLGFWLLTCVGFWLGGLIQSARCVDNIEQSRLAIVATQEDSKRRAAYLKKMREDEASSPVNRNDPHLTGYTKSSAT